MRPETRARVYDVIDGERDYQEAGRGNAKRHEGQKPEMTPGEFISLHGAVSQLRP